jgi:hypothetical protein
VNPHHQQILGEKGYPDLLTIPFPVDIVLVFRQNKFIPEIIDQSIQIKTKVIWLQEGILADPIEIENTREAGIDLIMDTCMRETHKRLMDQENLLSLMLLLAGSYRKLLWPYLLFIAATHLIQDRLKMTMSGRTKQHRVLFFFTDQVVHILIIIGVIALFESFHGPLNIPGSPAWAVFALVFVCLTQGWFITERVIFAENKEIIENILQTKFPRMIARTGMTALLTLARSWAFPGLALLSFSPYSQSDDRKRAMWTDLSVSILGFLIIFLALG